MEKEVINTKNAPKAVGPYSQGIKVGDFIFVAGQIAFDPDSGRLVEGDITVQTQRVLKNIGAVLEAAGSSLSDVIKTTVFLSTLDDFDEFNQEYAKFFPEASPPARITVGVNDLFLNALVEMDAIAIRN